LLLLSVVLQFVLLVYSIFTKWTGCGLLVNVTDIQPGLLDSMPAKNYVACGSVRKKDVVYGC